MNPFERVMLVLEGRGLQADRIPCMNPTLTVTVGFMEAAGVRWPEAHRNPEVMARLAEKGSKLAGFDSVNIPFDYVVEAEVFGAQVDFMEEPAGRGVALWPTVRKPIIGKHSRVRLPENVEEAGRIPVVSKAVRLLKQRFEGVKPVTVVMNAPFTCVGFYLMEASEFMGMLREAPEEAEGMVADYAEAFARIAQAYEEAGADIITLHDMGASCAVTPPQAFKTIAAPALKAIVKGLRCKTILSICGPNLAIVKAMVEVGASAVAFDEKTPIREARKPVDEVKPGYPVAGNLSPKLLAKGRPEEVSSMVRRVIAEGVDVVAPGCDLHLQTPTGNLKVMVETVERYGGRRYPFHG